MNIWQIRFNGIKKERDQSRIYRDGFYKFTRRIVGVRMENGWLKWELERTQSWERNGEVVWAN